MTIVSSGSMAIRSSGVLKAYLGSCVGLAVLAPKHHLGGLLHMLLPEPICDIPKSHFAEYASTGIPAFLESLARKGACPKDISAYLAGGGLVSPISRHDLAMNLGGRTLEICMSLLKHHGIAIQMLEANGISGYCMMLDVDRARCSIEPILSEGSASNIHPIPKPTQIQIASIMDNLHPIPQIVLGVDSMLANDAIGFSAVSSEIRKDQVFTGEVLSFCRRLGGDLFRKIETIDEALLVLGSKQLLKWIVTAHINRLLSHISRGYSLVRGGLFYHALATARLGEKIAAATGIIDPNLAYTSGLLHDIGKIVLDQYAAQYQPLLYRMLRRKNDDLISLEQNLFGIGHPMAGYRLAEKWNLPQPITEVIRFHNRPDQASEHRDLVHLVCLADDLAQRYLPGYIINDLCPSAAQESMHRLGLKPDQLSEILSVLTNIYESP